jgi:hypothetical protein
MLQHEDPKITALIWAQAPTKGIEYLFIDSYFQVWTFARVDTGC